MKRYNPNEIESKWQKSWDETQAYKVNDDDPRPKFYTLVEFPYPSGVGLHVGHCRPYITFDVMSRWRRMGGENVLFPMGWDSFGLPAEQYALKTGVHPAVTTEQNIATFKNQVKRLGLSFDWTREIKTSDPAYYKWTQWIFLNLFKEGLAYQAESRVWWCEGLKSVLADEEVINGRSERGDYPCERRALRQWMLAITKYADRLDADLDDVDYINSVKVQQRNWIGRSIGAEITFKVDGSDKDITVYTTRADTIFSCAFIVLAPENKLVAEITTDEQRADVENYVKETSSKSDIERQEEGDKEKTGVFTGAYAINPANGEKVPIWAADFVLAGYGTGAVFGDIHDERDFEFLNKFKIPARVTVIPEDSAEADKVRAKEYPFTGEGILIDSGEFTGMKSSEARDKIIAWLSEKGAAKEKVNYRLRDWVFSRQRYWGEPFPIVWVKQSDANTMYDEVAKWLPKEAVTKTVDSVEYAALPIVPSYLPVELPEVEDFQPKGLGQGPLADAEDWVHVWYNLGTGETKPFSADNPGEHWVEARRETDTMPNWAGSSWYFLRYLDSQNKDELASKAKIEEWMPVNWYNGGMEHTTLHLLYSRFWHKFLYDIGVVNTSEPYAKRTSHGLILSEDGTKMSKSVGNVVDPLEVVESYGSDTLRLYICFIGPFEQAVAWSMSGVAGCRRFIDRFWVLAQGFIENKSGEVSLNGEIVNKQLARVVAETNKKVSQDIPKLGFNTAVASLMSAVNELYKLRETLPYKENQEDWLRTFHQLILVATPFMPHVCLELWEQFGFEGSALSTPWPEWDEKALVNSEVTIAVQVNGKLRGEVKLPIDSSEEDVVKAANEDSKIKPHLENVIVIKTIYIKNKLINFVVKPS